MGNSIECYMEGHFKRFPQDKKFFYHKLTLWHSGTFSPICTHDELKPIMASIGFFSYVPDSTGMDSLTKRLASWTGIKSAVRENGGVNTASRQNLQKDKTTSAGAEPVKWREYAFGRMNLIPGSGLNPGLTTWPRLP